jgi:probable rRNA maturation factor
MKKLVGHYKLDHADGVLAFVDSRSIKRLNARYLKKNAATDVLSFPLRERGADGRFYLGDIIISAPQAFRQSFALDHGLERELEYLAIHGFLHLMGLEHFDGFEEEEEKIRHLLLQG